MPRETQAAKAERTRQIIAGLKQAYPDAHCELNHSNPLELLIATILSAQCTDKRVNMTTPALFHRFPTAYDLAKASVEEVFDYIKSISFPNNKAKHLVGMANILVNEFKGEVPGDVEDLQKMPGDFTGRRSFFRSSTRILIGHSKSCCFNG